MLKDNTLALDYLHSLLNMVQSFINACAGTVQGVRYCRVRVRNPQLEKATSRVEDAI